MGSGKHSSLLRYGNNYCRKKFYSTGPSGQFHKKFQRNLCLYRHFALSFDPGYAARGVNYAKKVL